MATKNILLLMVIAVIFFVLGYGFKAWQYKDICLDMGGGIQPDNYDICVID